MNVVLKTGSKRCLTSKHFHHHTAVKVDGTAGTALHILSLSPSLPLPLHMLLFGRRVLARGRNNVVGVPVQRGGTNEITEQCHLAEWAEGPLWAFLIVNSIIINPPIGLRYAAHCLTSPTVPFQIS